MGIQEYTEIDIKEKDLKTRIDPFDVNDYPKETEFFVDSMGVKFYRSRRTDWAWVKIEK